MKNFNKILGGGFLLLMSAGIQADQVILDDLIVDGSSCIGFDCVNGESFGFDTIRVKENNLRIKFQDTSASASFPGNDWQITANDSANGGANKFSIDDIDGGRTPFTIEAGAPSHSLYVDDGGRLGLGTSTPVVDIHSKSGNTPTLRLEQDGSSGFAPQTWDVAGNEANFFVRDATNGSTLPFRIFPGAPSNALIIEAGTGDIGVGTTSPSAGIHVRRTAAATATLLKLENNGNTKLVMNNTSTDTEWGFTNGITGMRLSQQGSGVVEMELSNAGGMTIAGNGNTKFTIDNTASATQWAITNAGESMRFSKQGSGVVELEMFSNGNVTVAGALTQQSDVNSKTAITELDSQQILALVSKLPITKWEYKDARGEAHIGPMAQDFYEAFALGANDVGISTIDTAGVALVAIQALVKKNQQLENAIELLQQQNRDIVALHDTNMDKVGRLEQVVELLMQAQENSRVLTSVK